MSKPGVEGLRARAARESAQALAKDGYLLGEDIDRIVARAARNAKFENSSQ